MLIPLLLCLLVLGCVSFPAVRYLTVLAVLAVARVLGFGGRVLRPILRLASVVLCVALPVALVNITLDAIEPRVRAAIRLVEAGGDPTGAVVMLALGAFACLILLPLYLWLVCWLVQARRP